MLGDFSRINIATATAFLRAVRGTMAIRCQWDAGSACGHDVLLRRCAPPSIARRARCRVAKRPSNRMVGASSSQSAPAACEKHDTQAGASLMTTRGSGGRLPGPAEQASTDVCYSFWNGAALSLLSAHELVDAPADAGYVLSAQSRVGGVSKIPGDHPTCCTPTSARLALAAPARPRRRRHGRAPARLWTRAARCRAQLHTRGQAVDRYASEEEQGVIDCVSERLSRVSEWCECREGRRANIVATQIALSGEGVPDADRGKRRKARRACGRGCGFDQ